MGGLSGFRTMLEQVGVNTWHQWVTDDFLFTPQ